MESRYDFMKESAVLDSDRSAWPDPLTLNYNSFVAVEPLVALELSDADIEKFWWATYKQYGSAEMDDVVLTLNGVMHKNFLEEDDIIFFPTKSDISTSFAEQ